jgi:biopolymer transport protein ExbB
MLVRGGPVMIPLLLCSVIALGCMFERWMRLRAGLLGNRAQAEELVNAARDLGPSRALDIARAKPTVLARVLQPVLERWSESRSNLEKAVEDAASRELRMLISSLRPLTVITVTAPLLGLFGTVIGIIIAFRDIAQSDAMGKPEALATGIAQALVCTASGLAIAIPTQAAYYWFRGRIDRFWRLVEESGERLFAVHAGIPAASAPPAPPAQPTAPPPVDPTLAPISLLAGGRP